LYATFRRGKAAGTPPQFSAAVAVSAAEFRRSLLHSMPPSCGGYAHAIFRLLLSTAAFAAAFYSHPFFQTAWVETPTPSTPMYGKWLG